MQAFPPSHLGIVCEHSLLSAWRRFVFSLSSKKKSWQNFATISLSLLSEVGLLFFHLLEALSILGARFALACQIGIALSRSRRE